jgi:hypothetical protein
MESIANGFQGEGEGAVTTVLATEARARDAVATCEAECRARLAQATAQAETVLDRGEQRAARLRAKIAAAGRERVAVVEAQTAALDRDARIPEALRDRLSRAVEQLADALVRGA